MTVHGISERLTMRQRAALDVLASGAMGASDPNWWPILQPPVYAILAALSRKGLVERGWRDGKIVYSLTRKGQDLLDDELNEAAQIAWREQQDGCPTATTEES